MNERIKELLNEATSGHEQDLSLQRTVTADEMVKFAEMIVQDIINVLESTNEIRHIASTTYDIGVVEGTIDRSISAITEHYGMKKHYRNKNERTMGRKVSSF